MRRSVYTKTIFVAISLLTYVVITCLVYAGPVNGIYGDRLITGQILWNYSVGILLIALTYLMTLKYPHQRAIPTLPATFARVVILVTVYVFYVLLVILFWVFVVVHPLDILVRLELLTKQATSMLPIAVAKTVENAVLGLPICLFTVAASVWQLNQWRKQVFSLQLRDLVTTVVLIVFSTVSCFTAARIFHTHNNVFPSLTWNFVVAFVAQALVNGLPEESFFRGYILPQFYAFVRSPLLAIMITIALFGASHIPSEILYSHLITVTWWQWILWSIFPPQPTGLLFAVLFWRTRSIMPGVILHTYITLAGFPFV